MSQNPFQTHTWDAPTFIVGRMSRRDRCGPCVLVGLLLVLFFLAKRLGNRAEERIAAIGTSSKDFYVGGGKGCPVFDSSEDFYSFSSISGNWISASSAPDDDIFMQDPLLVGSRNIILWIFTVIMKYRI